jgi:hypothetical protein
MTVARYFLSDNPADRFQSVRSGDTIAINHRSTKFTKPSPLASFEHMGVSGQFNRCQPIKRAGDGLNGLSGYLQAGVRLLDEDRRVQRRQTQDNNR